MKQIVDGQARFGMSLADFYRQEALVIQAGRHGVLIPPISEVVTEARPALAEVNPLPDGSVRWIALCPDCRDQGRTGAEYVWLRTPLQFCMRCANRQIGGKWRPVELPPERLAIERLLLARPDPETRIWLPGETVEQLRAENASLGVT